MTAFTWLQHPLLRALAPLTLLALLAPVAVRWFGPAWRELESQRQQPVDGAPATPRDEFRGLAVFLIAGFCLAFQKYYGQRDTYQKYFHVAVSPMLDKFFHIPPGGFDELYSHAWWSLARFLGYLVFPLTAWKLLYPRDEVLRLAGLRGGQLRRHGREYALCFAVIVPCLFFAATQPDFHSHYPFYKQASRSWLDLFLWEGIYLLHFFCLEAFFRGWWLQTLQPSLGAGAVFSMLVPYAMIHFGKPYLETNGALLAGLVLGTLSLQSRSMYGGFAIHALVAVTMDVLALRAVHAMPTAGLPW